MFVALQKLAAEKKVKNYSFSDFICFEEDLSKFLIHQEADVNSLQKQYRSCLEDTSMICCVESTIAL